MRPRIPFLSLVPEGEPAREVREAIERVISRGWFVLGPEVEAFEAGVRRGDRARPTPSASATAPMRSR